MIRLLIHSVRACSRLWSMGVGHFVTHHSVTDWLVARSESVSVTVTQSQSVSVSLWSSNRNGGSAVLLCYLSSLTLMTPSSPGMNTAALTVWSCPSNLLISSGFLLPFSPIEEVIGPDTVAIMVSCDHTGRSCVLVLLVRAPFRS